MKILLMTIVILAVISGGIMSAVMLSGNKTELIEKTMKNAKNKPVKKKKTSDEKSNSVLKPIGKLALLATLIGVFFYLIKIIHKNYGRLK